MRGRGGGLPLLNTANPADRPGIGGACGDRPPRLTVDFGQVGAEFLVDAHVRPLVEEVEVEVRQQAIRISGARRGFGGFGCLLHWISSVLVFESRGTLRAAPELRPFTDGCHSSERQRRSRALPKS